MDSKNYSYSNMSVEEFINSTIKFNNVNEIINTCRTQSEKGSIYERLWDICINFGFCSTFQKSEFTYMTGNFNNGNLKPLTTFKNYLTEKVVSGNSSGCSDISLFNKDNNTFTFITSKYPKSKDDITKQKSVAYYEVQNIISVIDANKHIYPNFKIFLLVPDKKSILEKVKNANKSSNYITKYMTEQNILDENDLNKCFLHFKADMLKHMKASKNGKINYDEIYLSPKCNLSLRFHQELITQKTSNLIEEGYKSFLWGCKCRSGKTYMFGGLIIKQFEIKQKLNVLIITPAPTETAPQFTDDLFNKFKEFEEFKIHHIDGSKNIEGLELDDSNIFVMSKQLLQKYIDDKTIMKIKNLKLDIIGFDENHFSGTTDLSKSILDSYSSKNTIKVYLTATYNKPLREWNIPEECQMYWDIEDEQICKSILVDKSNVNKLKEKHGDTSIIATIKHFTEKGVSLTDMFKPYENMPDLNFITTMFDSQRYDIIKDKIMGSKYGFCFDTLFALNKQKTKFQFENEVKTILRFISGSNKEVDFKNGDKSMFSRILKICSDKETRTPFTQIWFLPSNNINEISKCLEQLMKEDNVLKKYNVLCINRKNKDLAKDIKEDITKQEKIAKAEGKEGLILLAGNMLTLGITLNMCDVVALMNNTLSSDKVLQQMYRCMTEGYQKKFGFVVDLSISRVLNTCVNYTIYKNDKNIEDKIRYLFQHHLINIDVDMMEQKNLNIDAIVTKLMEIWKSDPVNNFKSLLRNLDNDYVNFDTSTQQIINKSFRSSLKDDKVNTTIEMKEDDDELQDLPSGKEKVRDESDKSEKSVSGGEENIEKQEINVSFKKDVLHYVIPLACMLTIKNANKDFVKMLNDIQENPKLLDMFDDMCLTWWNKKDLIDLIKKIVSEYFDKNSNAYNISLNFKMSLQSLIDRPKELLELCIECLTPKDIEKKKFGEVFTPLSFINNHMLKDLESYYKEKYNKNIFEDETLKWGDTTAGMGNFPIAIYYKLMDGLQVKIPNEKERKKHIIEKMLFMAEYNKKNCFIIQQIFNINNELKLNLYQGDSLQLDIQKEFGITKFDIVIGNPPYNEELKSTGAKALYNKFVEYYIEKCNLLCFVMPSRWFSAGKGLDSFRKNMLERTDIVYIKHFNDACEIFGNSVSIEGGVNYFLKDTKYKGDCNFNGSITKLNKYDVFVDGKFHALIDKLLTFDSVITIYLGRYFGIESNDKRLKNEKTKDTIKCYVSQQKGFEKYIDIKDLKKEYKFWKLITARANGGNGCFGNIFIGKTDEIHTGSYISFKTSDEEEVKSLLSYLKCRLPNLLLSLRKASQDISESTCKWIPLPPLNKEWNDDEVYKYFKLSEKDIKLIQETNIVGYKDIIKPKTQIEDSINDNSIEVKIESTKPKRKLTKK
jgi:16S rRNA G966 N2-methylase RsmD